MVRRSAERFRIQLETPCVSFALDPDGGSPEQDYHHRAQIEFEALLDAIEAGLPDALERAAAAAAVTTAPLAPGGCVSRVDTTIWQDGAVRGLPSCGHIEIGVAAPVDAAARERLQAAIIPELERLLPPKPPPQPPPPPEPAPSASWIARLRRLVGR